MTREEAIRKAINIVSYFEAHFAKSKEAREDAANIIEALEQEPCDDCIRREDALMALTGEYTDSPIEILSKAIKRINALSPVTPAEKVGHWEWVQYDGNPNIGNWHCSECRTIIPHMPEETDNTPIYKWCPMCGGRMK